MSHSWTEMLTECICSQGWQFHWKLKIESSEPVYWPLWHSQTRLSFLLHILLVCIVLFQPHFHTYSPQWSWTLLELFILSASFALTIANVLFQTIPLVIYNVTTVPLWLFFLWVVTCDHFQCHLDFSSLENLCDRPQIFSKIWANFKFNQWLNLLSGGMKCCKSLCRSLQTTVLQRNVHLS